VRQVVNATSLAGDRGGSKGEILRPSRRGESAWSAGGRDGKSTMDREDLAKGGSMLPEESAPVGIRTGSGRGPDGPTYNPG